MNGTMALVPGTYKRVPLPHKMLYPHGYYAIYIANQNIQCGKCEKNIPAKTFFRCATINNCQPTKENKSYPHCRLCLSFHLYNNEEREKILSVDEEMEELKKRSDFPKF